MTRKLLGSDKKLTDRNPFLVDKIMEMITVSITNTYFQFDAKYYRQRKGMAMEFPFFPGLCNIFIEELA
jgi:hypothetical protein